MNHEHSQKDKIVRLNDWGSPKVTEGRPKSFACSISIGELDRMGGFFPVRHVKRYCKKNYFFCNKELLFAYQRKFGGTFKCYAMDW